MARFGRSGHALYDAVLTALPMMDTRTKQRAAVLIISDGADTASDASLRDVRSALVRSDAFVYAIAIDPRRTSHQRSREHVRVERADRRKRRQYRGRARDSGLRLRLRASPTSSTTSTCWGSTPQPARRKVPQYSRARHQSRSPRERETRLYRDAAHQTARLRSAARLPSSGFSTRDASVRLAQRFIHGIFPPRSSAHHPAGASSATTAARLRDPKWRIARTDPPSVSV